MTPGHAFVLGSGIAGLTSAELLSRNGWRVTILETSHDLGGDASRSTQNWLHTGWLYAALPSRAALLACHRALQLFRPIYGRVLSPDTLNVERGPDGVSYPTSPHGWFASERVHYLYALETAELLTPEGRAWKRRLSSVAFPRLRRLGHATDAVTDLSANLVELLDRWEGDGDGHSRYLVVRSTDAQLNTRRVLDSLLGLLGVGTQVITNASYQLTTRRGRSTIVLDGESHTPDLVVMATGRGLPAQLAQIGKRSTAAQFKSVCCPVVVLKRALDLPNLIRFTPYLPDTVNHIKYEVRGLGLRSTIGSYDYYPAEQRPDISPFLTRVFKRFALQPNDVATVYYGTKTEFTGPAERRYAQAVEQVNGNTFWAIPGKFSLFPLLAHELAERLGLRTDLEPASCAGGLQLAAASTFPERAFLGLSEPAKPHWGTA